MDLPKICTRCNIEKPIDHFDIFLHIHEGRYNTIRRAYCRDCRYITTRKSNLKLRLDIVNNYSDGANACNCCGESEIKFLSLDHIENGKGNPYIGKRSTQLYRKLRLENFPDRNKYQILCHNCNMAKGFYGICPHKEKSIGFAAS